MPDLDSCCLVRPVQEFLGIGYGIGIGSSLNRLDSIEPLRSIYEETGILRHATHCRKPKNTRDWVTERH